MKVRELSFKDHENHFVLKPIKDFFNPYELWGRQNRNQFLVGLLLVAAYFLGNIIYKSKPPWDPFLHSSIGLLIAVFVCIGLIVLRYATALFNLSPHKYPWYEKYMPMIISLLGLITLIAIQNLSGAGSYDASLWINMIVLLVIFIIAAGYFVEGNSNEKIIKIWFSLLGYFFSVIAVFYFLDAYLIKI
jgi:uncharacterized membrane protein SirB2